MLFYYHFHVVDAAITELDSVSIKDFSVSVSLIKVSVNQSITDVQNGVKY